MVLERRAAVGEEDREAVATVTPERPWSEEDLQAALVESTLRSGVPLKVTDPVVLARLAALSASPLPALLTVAEVAPYLRKSKSTCWRWIQEGLFPIETRVIAGQTYIRRVDLEEYLGTPIGELRR